MEAGLAGKIYVVMEGTITIEQENGTRHSLAPGDSVFIPAGEPRAVLNLSGSVAAMIVVTPPSPT